LFSLSVVWLLCCVPVVTAGAATAALYRMMFNMKEDKVCDLKAYFRAFRSNFRKATVLWLIMAGILAFLGADYYAARAGLETISFLSVPLVFTIAISIFVLMWSQYAFAYIARFENDTKTVIRNTVLIMLVNFPWSFLLLAIFAVAVLFFPLLLFFAAIGYIVFADRIHQRVFAKYIRNEEVEENADL
jgi:uncharacterized membrane protein YesL